MDINISQPMLFDFSDTASGAVEFFPEIWGATESLTSPDLSERRDALDRLVVLDAPRLSPLVAYIVATRIFDTDMELRHKSVDTLGKILSPRETGKLAHPSVRLHLKAFFSQIGIRGFLNLLEVAESFPESESKIASLLNICSQSGDYLVQVMNDRKTPSRRNPIFSYREIARVLNANTVSWSR